MKKMLAIIFGAMLIACTDNSTEPLDTLGEEVVVNDTIVVADTIFTIDSLFTTDTIIDTIVEHYYVPDYDDGCEVCDTVWYDPDAEHLIIHYTDTVIVMRDSIVNPIQTHKYHLFYGESGELGKDADNFGAYRCAIAEKDRHYIKLNMTYDGWFDMVDFVSYWLHSFTTDTDGSRIESPASNYGLVGLRIDAMDCECFGVDATLADDGTYINRMCFSVAE